MKITGTRIYPIKIPINEYPEFQDRLKWAMEIRDINTKELSSRLFLTSAALSGYRNGTRLPNCMQLRQIAKELDVSTDYLLGLDEYIYISIDEKHHLNFSPLQK